MEPLHPLPCDSACYLLWSHIGSCWISFPSITIFLFCRQQLDTHILKQILNFYLKVWIIQFKHPGFWLSLESKAQDQSISYIFLQFHSLHTLLHFQTVILMNFFVKAMEYSQYTHIHINRLTSTYPHFAQYFT